MIAKDNQFGLIFTKLRNYRAACYSNSYYMLIVEV